MALIEASVPRVARRGVTLRWIYPTVSFAIDLALVNLAFASAFWLRYRLGFPDPVKPQYLVTYRFWLAFELLISVLIPAAFAMEGLYRQRLGLEWLGEVFAVARAATLGMAAAIIATYLFQHLIDQHSRGVLILTWLLIIVLCGIGRGLTRRIMIHLHRRGWHVRRVLVAGSTPIAKMVMQNLIGRRDQGYELVGFLHENGGAPAEFGRFHSLGAVASAAGVIERHEIDEVIIALSATSHVDILSIRDHCIRQDVALKIAPDLYEMSLSRVRMDDIAGIPLIDAVESPLHGINLLLKRVIDVVCAAILLIVLLPIFAIVALAIALDSPGPIFIAQERVGCGNELFPFFKFRSMYAGAEKRHSEIRARSIHGDDDRATKDPHDPRRTHVGRVIRKLSIDELPQLLNVLRGEMSLVGPRPALPSEVTGYESWHYKRFDTRPGMTGLWQVSGRSHLNFDEMVMMDIYYIDNWSLALDVKILLRTPLAVLTMRGAY